MKDHKPKFRDRAKRIAYEHLEYMLADALKERNRNKYEIHKLAKRQNELKADIAGLSQLIWEMKK